jgi:hypothetical protein
VFLYNFKAERVWQQQGPPNPVSSIMVLYLWNGYIPVLPKGFAIRWIVNLSSNHYHPSPCVALAYHNSLLEKGTILAETFANFLLTMVNSDSF